MLVSSSSTGEGPKIFKVQMLLLFIFSTVLMLGFYGTREWRRMAEVDQVLNIIQGWDGFAWYAWLAVAPGILLLIRRYPLAREHFGRNLRRILLGSLVLYVMMAHGRFVLDTLPEIWRGAKWNQLFDLEAYAYNTFAMMPLDFLTYCGFFAVTFSVNYYYENRRHAEENVQIHLQAAHMQTELTRAELAVLRAQLHPHFVFNSFNALATLIRQRRNDEALEVIVQLGALLRLAIDRTDLAEITMQQEIDFIRSYLKIEQVRFGDKLRVEISIDPATQDALVPNIVLQPLVENAIKHGIARRTTPGTVRVAAQKSGSRLRIEIINDEPEDPMMEGPNPMAEHRGIGMANSRSQLQKLYGADFGLEMTQPGTGKTIVRLDLPLRTAPVTGIS